MVESHLGSTLPCEGTPNRVLSIAREQQQGKRSAAGVKLKFERRDTVFHAGDPAERLYEVVDGALMIFKLLPDGRRQIVEIVPQGWICGFGQDNVYDGTCEALTQSTVVSYSRADVALGGALATRLLRQAENQFCALHDHNLTLGKKTAEEKVATFLMRLMPGRGRETCAGPKPGEDTAQLRFALSRGEIADYLGLTIETVSRMLSQLERNGLVEIGTQHGEIRVNDVCALCRTARTSHST
jgi:CRP-like cAMP-binding protein